MSIGPYTGSVNEDFGDVERKEVYLVTIQQGTHSRSFVGEYSKTSWDRSGEEAKQGLSVPSRVFL